MLASYRTHVRLSSPECIAPSLSLVASTFYLRIVLLLPYLILDSVVSSLFLM